MFGVVCEAKEELSMENSDGNSPDFWLNLMAMTVFNFPFLMVLFTIFPAKKSFVSNFGNVISSFQVQFSPSIGKIWFLCAFPKTF